MATEPKTDDSISQEQDKNAPTMSANENDDDQCYDMSDCGECYSDPCCETFCCCCC